MLKKFVKSGADGSKFVGLLAIAGALACGLYAVDAAQAEPAVAGPVVAPVSAAVLSKEEADSLIYERQQLMIQLDKDAALIGSIVAGEVPPTKLAEVTKSLAEGAKESAQLWKRPVPGGDAKPEVWVNHDDYMARMNRFALKSAEMAKIAEAGNVNGVIEIMIDAMPCKECHDLYRVPKKKPAA